MIVKSSFAVPDAVSFEEAIALTQSLLDALEQETAQTETLEQVVQDLVQSENGARGFFVTYLSDDRSLIDSLIPVVVNSLKASPDVVSPLLVKNLVMSTAMAITHRRNQHEEMAQGSDRVRSRTAQIIKSLPLPELKAQAGELANTIKTGTGAFQPFLERWHYDQEQKQAMYQALKQVGLV